MSHLHTACGRCDLTVNVPCFTSGMPQVQTGGESVDLTRRWPTTVAERSLFQTVRSRSRQLPDSTTESSPTLRASSSEIFSPSVPIHAREMRYEYHHHHHLFAQSTSNSHVQQCNIMEQDSKVQERTLTAARK